MQQEQVHVIILKSVVKRWQASVCTQDDQLDPKTANHSALEWHVATGDVTAQHQTACRIAFFCLQGCYMSPKFVYPWVSQECMRHQIPHRVI